MSAPLHAHLELKFSNSCNCLCFRKRETSPVYIDEEMKPQKYCKKKHGTEEIAASYKRIEQIILQEFKDHHIEKHALIEMIEKMTELPINGGKEKKEPLKVRELRRLIEAIDELKRSITQEDK